MNHAAHTVEIQRAKERLAASGGYEIVHECRQESTTGSPGTNSSRCW
jgi:hypothetical protein